jgi:hypothetical protein
MKLIHYMREHAAALIAAVNSGYHPERHYMRGPGPACAARAATPQATQRLAH